MTGFRLVWIFVLAALFASCAGSGDHGEVVVKVTDYRDRLLAHYEYDENDKLRKRTYTHPETKAFSELIFHYDNDRVSRVDFVDHTAADLSGEKRFVYDLQGKVVQVQTYANGRIQGTFELNYSPEGRVVSTNLPGRAPTTFYEYDERGNVVKTTMYYENSEGELFEKVLNFTYDTLPKPNFGFDFLPGMEMLPKSGTNSNWEQSLSQNNMLSEGFAGNEYVHYTLEYDDENRLSTITTKWKDMETRTPTILRIAYGGTR